MKNHILFVIMTLSACVTDYDTSTTDQPSTTCVSPEATGGHPTPGVTQCPNPTPVNFAAEQAASAAYANANAPTGVPTTARPGDFSCIPLTMGTDECTFDLWYGAGDVIIRCQVEDLPGGVIVQNCTWEFGMTR